MAIYHCSFTVISRSQGRSSVAAAAYRSGERLHDNRLDKTADFGRKQDVVYKEILTPENAPQWMKDRETLWNAVEEGENRKDAQVARELSITLPRELTRGQNIALAREFVKQEFVDRGMVADLCIHEGKTKGGEEQPHAHVMLTLRKIEGNGFGPKERSWNDKENIRLWRERWAECENRHLSLNGIDQRVDHRTLEEQGIDLQPQKKIGHNILSRIYEARVEEHERIARENGEKILADPNIALNAITRQQSTFTHHDLARFVNRHSVDGQQFQEVYDKVQASKEIVCLGQDDQGRERFTTQEMLALETKMLSNAKELERLEHGTHPRESNLNLSDEQKDALSYITAAGDMKCLIGYAGTGKSYLLKEARETWEHEGYRVQGATLSGIAAENLEGASGIESRTIASRTYYWDRGEHLTHRDILVVDEAGMIGSRQMMRILDEANTYGAKVILIGDPQQLQAIEAGAAFRAIAEQNGFMELTEIRRQRESWQREATKEFALGKVSLALDRYDRHDHVHAFETDAVAKKAMVEMWNDARLNEPQKTQIMLAYTRKDVQELNEIAREYRRDNSELGQDHLIQTERGERSFAEQDRLYFLQNNRELGVKNGTLGTIETIQGDQITVRLDREDLPKQKGSKEVRQVTFDVKDYPQIDYGYAATVHKAQGVTVDRSYVLASKHLDGHASYVGMSRHRESADLFYSREQFSNSQELAETLSRDRRKDISLDYPAVEKEFACQRGIEWKEERGGEQTERIIGIEKNEKVQVVEKTDQRIERQAKFDRPLTSEEIKTRYGIEPKTLSQRLEEIQANPPKRDPLRDFKDRYEREHGEKAQQYQAELKPSFEKLASQLEERMNTIEKRLEGSPMPEPYQEQLEKLSVRLSKEKDIMNYYATQKPEFAEKVRHWVKQYEHRQELIMEREIGGFER